MLIAQRLQHHGGVLQDLRLFVQIGEGVDAAIGEHQHPAQRGDLVEHTVGGQVGGTQAMLLVEHGAHQVGGAEDALHQEVGSALGAQRHGLGGAVPIGVAGDDLIGGGIFAQLGEHGADLVGVTHQNGGGDTLPAGLDYRLDHRLVVGGCHGDDTGAAAACGGNDAVNGVYHGFSSSKKVIHPGSKRSRCRQTFFWDNYTPRRPQRQ